MSAGRGEALLLSLGGAAAFTDEKCVFDTITEGDGAMIRVAVNGVCGRMGSRVAALVNEADDMVLAGVAERSDHDLVGEDVSVVIGGAVTGVPVSAEIGPDADVVIDFTVPASTAALAGRCAEIGAALVSGTTNLTDEQRRRLEDAAEHVPVVWAPNMSVGVNLLFQLAGWVAKALGDEYDVEIVETHHRFKKDAPSGTARRLAEKVAEGLGRDLADCAVHGRHGDVGERTTAEIGIHAVRGGDVVGDHTVVFAALGERIELIHRAHSRDVFVRGALRAARWVAGKPAGLYSMEDVLGPGA